MKKDDDNAIDSDTDDTETTTTASRYPQERLRGLQRARAEGRSAAGPDLKPGEATVVARVRTAEVAVRWWESLTPMQRGSVVLQAYDLSQPAKPRSTEKLITRA